MSRTQKKCLIASVATHGLLLAILFIGPAFFTPSEKVETHQFITMMPFNTRITDDATSIPGAAPTQVSQPPPAQPPQAVPIPIPPPQPQPDTHPIVTPRPQPTPPPKPAALPPQKNGDEFTPVKPKVTEPDEFKPVKGPPSKTPAKVKPKESQDTQAADAQRIIAAQMQKRIGSLSSSLAKDSMVQIGSSSDSSEASANYSDLVYSIYFAAWHPPASITDERSVVTVRVTISRNGQVTRHEVTKSSGNAAMDRSIENTLNNVTVVAPFPDGSKDLERFYSINFDLSAKKSM